MSAINGHATMRSYCTVAIYVANSNTFIATYVTGNNTTYRGLSSRKVAHILVRF